ncbi:hypothetical protein [Halohasta litorea]|uniref:hypothetical protein n=1 Tax=Halohasta litorea TaxID=869891 RepID=UPI0036D2127F
MGNHLLVVSNPEARDDTEVVPPTRSGGSLSAVAALLRAAGCVVGADRVALFGEERAAGCDCVECWSAAAGHPVAALTETADWVVCNWTVSTEGCP